MQPIAQPIASAGHRAFDSADRTHHNLDSLPPGDVYKLLSCAVQPRPIAWVSTLSVDGIANLAPFSFFTVASRAPATVMVSISERIGSPGSPKDTLVNIEATGCFVVNIPSATSVAAVTASFATVPADVDEFAMSGMTPVASQSVAAPSVLEALVSIECLLRQTIVIGTDTVVLGTVVDATSKPGVLSEDLHVDIREHPFLGRLAGPYYTTEMNRVAQ